MTARDLKIKDFKGIFKMSNCEFGAVNQNIRHLKECHESTSLTYSYQENNQSH